MSMSLREEAELFLIHEAELLDTLRFHDWHALLTDDVRYVIPSAEYSDRPTVILSAGCTQP